MSLKILKNVLMSVAQDYLRVSFDIDDVRNALEEVKQLQAQVKALEEVCPVCRNTGKHSVMQDEPLQMVDEPCPVCTSKRIKHLQAALQQKTELLKRWKKTLEPFPVSSDLKALKEFMDESPHGTEEDAKVLNKLYKIQEKTYRKLYKDTEQALSTDKEGENE